MPDDTKKRASSKKATPVVPPRAAAKATPAPKRSATGSAAKAPSAKASVGKPAAKKAPAAKAAVARPAAKKPVVVEPSARKPSASKTAARKPAAKKTAAGKAAVPAPPKPQAAKPAKAPKAAAPRRATSPKAAAKPAAKPARAKAPAKAKAAPRLRTPPSSPDPDGFFVARVRGEDAVREAPHSMLEGADWDEEDPVAPVDEGLGELPWAYGDDTLVALPRDPRTLYLYWDHARETLQRAFDGLDHPRAQIWLFARGAGWERVRVIDFALESRGYYVHDLEPGRVYRAEIHLVDRAGRERLVSQPSNPMGLPPVGPSPVVDDRFVRIPWEFPLPRLLGPGVPGGPFSEELRALLARLSDWSRVRAGLPGAPGTGGAGGRPTSPEGGFGRPSSPSSPFGPFGPAGEGGR